MASAVRFLHCAGFRFDSPSWEGAAEWQKLRNQDLWQIFEAVLSLCLTEKVDFLFLTGNLFEQEYVSKETVARVAESFAKLDGVRVFITPGEKDPLVITSAYRLVVWPPNVHIFSGNISCVEIPSLQAIVYGAGWTAYSQERSFLDGFEVERDGKFRFMLLHAEVDSGKNTEGFIPVTLEQIASSGLTYLALGHKEVWNGIQKAGETFWADCGSPEVRSLQQRGPHGVLLGEIGKESCQFEYRELAQRRYMEKVLPLQADLESLTEKITEDMSFQIGEDVVALVELSAEKRVGYSILPQIFGEKMQECLVEAVNTETYKYWQLVRKVGQAAIGQGWEEDED